MSVFTLIRPLFRRSQAHDPRAYCESLCTTCHKDMLKAHIVKASEATQAPLGSKAVRSYMDERLDFFAAQVDSGMVEWDGDVPVIISAGDPIRI